jgi:hypothetical protein
MRRRRAPRRRRRRCPFPSSALSPRTRQDHKLAPSSRLLARSPPALACRTGTGQKSTKKIADFFFVCVTAMAAWWGEADARGAGGGRHRAARQASLPGELSPVLQHPLPPHQRFYSNPIRAVDSSPRWSGVNVGFRPSLFRSYRRTRRRRMPSSLSGSSTVCFPVSSPLSCYVIPLWNVDTC